jgi:predicted nucleic acid-binding Zn ribbon protein
MIYGLNILRIAGIVWIAHGWGEGTAMQAFHLLGGSVLIFAATLLLLTLGDKVGKLRIFTTRVNQEPCTLCKDSLMKGESFCSYCGAFLKTQKQSIAGQNMVRIMVVILIALLIIPIQIPPFALAKGTASIDLGTFSPNEIKNEILPTIPGWDLEFLYRDLEVEKAAQWDAALVYCYRKQGPDDFQPIVFVLIQIMKGRHSWEASLYVWPAQHGYPTATMLVERDVDILENPRIAGRFLEFIRVRSTVPEAVVYWFEEAQFTINETIVSRYVSISLDAYPENLARAGLIEGPNDADGMQAILLPMARSIAEHWDPLKTWTLIQVGISQWTEYLLIGTVSPCIMAASFLYLKLRTDRKRNAELFKRLIVPLERGVLEAVASSSKKGLPTGRAIEEKYRETAGKEIEPENLVYTLEAAKDTGLVKRDVSNNEDEPVLVWKNRF